MSTDRSLNELRRVSGFFAAALYLDGGLAEADRVLGQTLFNDNDDLLHIWMNLPRHPLQVSCFYNIFIMNTL